MGTTCSVIVASTCIANFYDISRSCLNSVYLLKMHIRLLVTKQSQF